VNGAPSGGASDLVGRKPHGPSRDAAAPLGSGGRRGGAADGRGVHLLCAWRDGGGRAGAEAEPAAPLVWFGSASIKLFGGRPELAIEQFERHLALDPASPLYAFVTGAQGIALMLLGSPAEAAARIGEALRHVPDQRPFRLAHAAALGLVGRTAEARAALAGMPAEAQANALAQFRDPAHRALMAEGLAKAAG